MGPACWRGCGVVFAGWLAGCGDATPGVPEFADPPRNVLITLIDAWAAGHLAAYGYERETMPFFERIAGESVLFEDASSAAAYTLASVASLMTGSTTEVHGVASPGQVLPDSMPVMAEIFRNDGFETHGVSTNAHIIGSFGFDRGFDEYHYVPVALSKGGSMQVPKTVLDGMQRFLGTKRTKPFFAYWHLLPPHAPYDPPEPFAQTFAGYLEDTKLSRKMWERSGRRDFLSYKPNEIQGLSDLYDSTLRYVDTVLEDIYQGLEANGLLDETLWILLSDHGEAFGQHQTMQHSSVVYQELVHVPLTMRFPGGEGRRIESAVSLVDLFPTLVDLYDLDAPESPSGFSLRPLLEGRSFERPAGLFLNSTRQGNQVGLRSGSWKLIHNRKSKIYKLFDLSEDPGEQMPQRGEARDVYVSLREELDLRAAHWEAVASGQRVDLAPEIEEQLRAIGYIDELLPESTGSASEEP